MTDLFPKIDNPNFCTKNERKFLDRIKETYRYDEEEGTEYIQNIPSMIFQHDFPGIDLKELTNGRTKQ